MKNLFLSLLILSLASCNSDPSGTSDTSLNSSNAQITGIVSAAPVDGATVYLFTLKSDGSYDTSLGNTTTDSAGNFSFSVASQSGPVEIVAYNGSYNEEASGLPITLSDVFRTRLPSLSAGAISIGVTPITELASTCSDSLLPITGTTLSVNIANCNKSLSLASGLTDITKAPANPNITLADPTSQSAKYALLLAGISQFANQNNLDSSLVVMDALRNDFKLDGKFDGKNNGATVTYSDAGSTPMNTHMWNNDLAFSVNYYRNSSSIFYNALVPLLVANPNLTCTSDASTKCGAICVNINGSKYHCGTCGNACSAPSHATAGCNAGVCGVGSCSTGYANCNDSSGDGCEVNTTNDASNCGSCGVVCTGPANASGACSSGVCSGIGSCNAGYGNCDGNAANGCEVSTNSDVNNCGACGTVCGRGSNVATASCSSSTCGIAACNFGYANCNGMVGDGCEAYLNSDMNNCGACGNVCGMGQTCTSGVCH